MAAPDLSNTTVYDTIANAWRKCRTLQCGRCVNILPADARTHKKYATSNRIELSVRAVCRSDLRSKHTIHCQRRISPVAIADTVNHLLSVTWDTDTQKLMYADWLWDHSGMTSLA